MEDYDGWAPSRSFETEWTLGHLEMDYTKTLVEDPCLVRENGQLQIYLKRALPQPCCVMAPVWG